MTADAWRLFVAVPVPGTVRDALEVALAPVRAATGDHLRWTVPATWHVTLAFLGEVDSGLVDVVEPALARAVGCHDAFDVRLHRAGRFGRGVLFLGFDDPSFAALRRLGADVRQELSAADVPFDDRPLHPHLTLARPRDRRGRGVSRSRLDDVDRVVSTIEPEAWRVGHVELLRSHLGGAAPRHGGVLRVPLRT